MEYFFLVNSVCMIFSLALSANCFKDGNKLWGWLNLVASAMNAASVFLHFA